MASQPVMIRMMASQPVMIRMMASQPVMVWMMASQPGMKVMTIRWWWWWWWWWGRWQVTGDGLELFYLRRPENTAFKGIAGAKESIIVWCKTNCGWPIKGWPPSWCQGSGSILAWVQKRLLAKSCRKYPMHLLQIGRLCIFSASGKPWNFSWKMIVACFFLSRQREPYHTLQTQGPWEQNPRICKRLENWIA